MRDLQHRVSIQSSILPTAVATNTTTNGTGIDTLGWESVTMVFHVNTRTDGTFTPTIQTAPDNATWTTLDPSAYIGGVAPAGQSAVGILVVGVQSVGPGAGLQGMQRYVRAVDVSTAVTSGGNISADIILAFPRHSGAAV